MASIYIKLNHKSMSTQYYYHLLRYQQQQVSKLTVVLFSSTVNENLVIRTLRMGRIKKVFVYFLIFLNWALT